MDGQDLARPLRSRSTTTIPVLSWGRGGRADEGDGSRERSSSRDESCFRRVSRLKTGLNGPTRASSAGANGRERRGRAFAGIPHGRRFPQFPTSGVYITYLIRSSFSSRGRALPIAPSSHPRARTAPDCPFPPAALSLAVLRSWQSARGPLTQPQPRGLGRRAFARTRRTQPWAASEPWVHPPGGQDRPRVKS